MDDAACQLALGVPEKSQVPPGARDKDAPEGLRWPNVSGAAGAQPGDPPASLTPSLLPTAPAVSLLTLHSRCQGNS